MASARAEPAAAALRLRCPADWFDTESAAVVTILLGVFHVLLSASFGYTIQNPPKLFILTLVLGILIIAGGSFTMANERNPRRILVQCCVCSHVIALLVALLAFGLYCYNITQLQEDAVCLNVPEMYYYLGDTRCPPQQLKIFSWCVTLLLIIYDIVAVVMNCFLSVIAIRTLKRA